MKSTGARDLKIIKAYTKQKASTQEICARFEVSYDGLLRILKANKIEPRGHDKGPPCPAPSDPARRNYEIHQRRQQGYTIQSIATAYGVGPTRVRQLLEKRPKLIKIGKRGRPPAKGMSATPLPITPAEKQAYRASLERRLGLFRQIGDDPGKQAIEYELCRRDVVRFINNWGWTFDPRNSNDGDAAWLPFDLFPRQIEMLRFMEARLRGNEDGLIEKSRAIGYSWLGGALALHRWIFVPGFTTLIGAATEPQVDEIGNPNSFFEKMRNFRDRLPQWFLPKGFFKPDHDNFKRMINPENGNSITGQVGDNIGRGGRATLLILDEAAFIERADRVNASTSQTTRCRIWGSSVNGMGNLFARMRFGGSLRLDQVFRFHYTDTPSWTPERVEAEKKRLSATPWVFASEMDIDYSASVEGVCIPAKWVEAAVKLEGLLAAKGIKLGGFEAGIAGLDVGGGKAQSVMIVRRGPVVEMPEHWGNPDTTETAHTALDKCRQKKVVTLNFDEVGIGKGVLSVLSLNPVAGLEVKGINTGVSPSMTMWEDGKNSKQKFGNLKAEAWWLCRERFRLTYEHVNWLDGKTEDAAQHDLVDLISIPREAIELQTQLSVVRAFRNERGRTVMETKTMLATRGVASPDQADALVLTFIPGEPEVPIVMPFIADGPVHDRWAPRW